MGTINRINRRFLVSLQTGMSAIVLNIFFISTWLIIFLASLSFSQVLFYLSDGLINSISESINQELSILLQPTIDSAKLSSWLIADRIINPKNFSEVMQYTQNLLPLIPQARIIYWGDEQGNYVGSQWDQNHFINNELIENETNPPKHWMIYRDETKKIIKIENKPIDYDPRNRPWYRLAKQEKQEIWTHAYQFYSINKVGITTAIPTYFNNQLIGVFGIDIELDTLSNFLRKQYISQNGVALIINEQGHVIAYSRKNNILVQKNRVENNNILNIKQLSLPYIEKAFQLFKKQNKYKFSFQYNHINYLASFIAINQLPKHHWYISIIVPRKDFIENLQHYNHLIMLILLFFCFLALMAISLFTKKISIPINKLSNELSEIKFFRLEKNSNIKTYIEEISVMNQAVESMKTGLKSFKKYVPENLVRQLIYSKEAAQIGGTHRDVALFFSNIVNFTKIVAHLDPSKMTRYLCDYFDEMANIISKNGGIIDKYMGDSIMAFWGAPLADDKAIQHICTAAIQCQAQLVKLNMKWHREKKIIFPTHIGLHFGNVMIGNVGSSERLNYTAIGDAVNLASRLEKLNKYYGTKIIVSDNIRNEVNHLFLFRILDRSIVKGKKEPITIYELLEEKNHLTDPRLLEFCEYYQHGFTAYQHAAWDQAISYFKEGLKISPDDYATQVMIKRCRYMKKMPPLENWNGVWIFKTKN